MKSVLQKNKECWVCGRTDQLHSHHIFFGTSNRKQSEKYGLKVWLCYQHHTGNDGVHFNKVLDARLKKYAQKYFMEHYGTLEDFREVFGKSWL